MHAWTYDQKWIELLEGVMPNDQGVWRWNADTVWHYFCSMQYESCQAGSSEISIDLTFRSSTDPSDKSPAAQEAAPAPDPYRELFDRQLKEIGILTIPDQLRNGSCGESARRLLQLADDASTAKLPIRTLSHDDAHELALRMRGRFPVREDHGVATPTVISHAPRIARCTCAQRGNRRICEQRKRDTIARTEAL